MAAVNIRHQGHSRFPVFPAPYRGSGNFGNFRIPALPEKREFREFREREAMHEQA